MIKRKFNVTYCFCIVRLSRKQSCSSEGCTIFQLLKGEDTCTAPSRPLSIDDVNDLKMDGNVAVINACKGNNGFWAQLVDGDKWENIDAKVKI